MSEKVWTADEIYDKFMEKTGNMSDEEWWNWVKSWLDEDTIVGIYENWDIEIMADCLKEWNIINDNDEIEY